MSAFHRGSLNTIEREILELWDEGLSIQRIARRMQRSTDYVSSSISRLVEGNETRLHVSAMQSGSAALLAAIEAAR